MRLIVVLFITVSIALSTPVAMAGLLDQLVAHYPLDGDAVDVTGAGNHGTLHGPLAAEDRYGAAASALEFDGLNDLVDTPSLGNWGDELTFSVWVYPNSTGTGSQTIIGSREEGTGSTRINLRIVIDSPGTMTWLIAGNNTHSTLTTTDTIPWDHWTHVLCDWSKLTGTMRIYWDGELKASGPIGGLPRYIDTGVGFGNYCKDCSSPTAAPLNGRLDEVRVYPRVLDANEIADLAAGVLFDDGFELGDYSRWSAHVR